MHFNCELKHSPEFDIEMQYIRNIGKQFEPTFNFELQQKLEVIVGLPRGEKV